MLKGQPELFRQFLLVGNGSYRNRGCEAIVRGTLEILREEFGPDVRARAAVFAAPAEVSKQNTTELDAQIHSFPMMGLSGRRWSARWLLEQVRRRLFGSLKPHLAALKGPAASAAAALEIGGDNYTLDYGVPQRFIEIDRFLLSDQIPVVLWGASVGPFEADPAFAPEMFDHLRRLKAIFVRETHSLDYLRSKGVADNVHLVADPAFLLPAVAPPVEKLGFSVMDEPVGINLSPLMARFRGEGTPAIRFDRWLSLAVELVMAAGRALQRPMLLVPHVGSAEPLSDDFSFLERVGAAVQQKGGTKVRVLPRGLSAGEIKWLISRCAVFAGARTHSTIAAMSSHVPTLTIGYSLKADGINRDIYGHHDFRIPVAELTAEKFAAQLKFLLQNRVGIRAHLANRIPEFCARARSAGPLLRKVLQTDGGAVPVPGSLAAGLRRSVHA